jgi:hypothetical protein
MKLDKDFNEEDVKDEAGFNSTSKKSIEVKKVTTCVQVVMIIFIQLLVFFVFWIWLIMLQHEPLL